MCCMGRKICWQKVLLIYKVKCKECQASYIGETSRLLKDRFAQHCRANTSSAVFDHQHTTGQPDSEPRWFMMKPSGCWLKYCT